MRHWRYAVRPNILHYRPGHSVSLFRHISISMANQIEQKPVYPTVHSTTINNPRLRLLNKLRSKQFPLLTFIDIPSVRQAQLVAQTGVDGIIIDAEHGLFGDEATHTSAVGISSMDVSPVIRIRGTSHDIIKRALDTGAHALLVPQINTAQEAEQVVASTKFPPQGIRGQGSYFPALAFGISTPEYVRTANQTVITMVQIETRAGVENVDAIAAVPGVDLLFIGPNDLALSLLGYTPAKGHEQEFVAALDKVVAAARKHGKWVGRLVNNGEAAKQARSRFDMVVMAHDTVAMQNWYRGEIAVAQSK